MNKKIQIDNSIVKDMWILLHSEKIAGQLASSADLFFMTDDAWLKDSVVIDWVVPRNGGWEVYLVFAHVKNPLRFIAKKITRCFSRQKALSTAFYMCKSTANDGRGTLALPTAELQLCNN